MPQPFAHLKLQLQAEPDRVYRDMMPPQPKVQPLTIKFTLQVTIESKTGFDREVAGSLLHVKLSQDDKEIAHAPQIQAGAVRRLKIPSGGSESLQMDLHLEDAHVLETGVAEAEGVFTPTGDTTSITIPVESAY